MLNRNSIQMTYAAKVVDRVVLDVRKLRRESVAKVEQADLASVKRKGTH